MKGRFGAMAAVGVCMALAGGTVCAEEKAAEPAAGASVLDQIKDESEGIGRFRWGGFGSFGYAGSVGSNLPSKVSGFGANVGVYGAFTPIRDFAEIETGVEGLVVIGSDPGNNGTGQKSAVGYGMQGARAYAGPVFPFSSGRHALALGVYKDLTMKVKLSTKSKAAVTAPGSKFVDISKNQIDGGFGAYLEWQWLDGKDSSGQSAAKSFMFLRLTAGAYDFVSPTGASSQEQYAGLSIGLKGLGF